VADADRPHRLFVAVPVPPDIREACQALIDPIRATAFGRTARWVHLETLHLTLRFLGDTAPDRVPAVAEAVTNAITGREAFEVCLGGAGSFPPSGRKIRALWLGIESGADALGALVGVLAGPLEGLGWPHDDRPYRPHLTVARTDATAIRDAALTAQALEAAAEGWRRSFTADRVVLFRSHLGGGPSRHERVAEVALRG
jgi:2'-5' RNA ligase